MTCLHSRANFYSVHAITVAGRWSYFFHFYLNLPNPNTHQSRESLKDIEGEHWYSKCYQYFKDPRNLARNYLQALWDLIFTNRCICFESLSIDLLHSSDKGLRYLKEPNQHDLVEEFPNAGKSTDCRNFLTFLLFVFYL